jgi:DNA repair protein RadC
MILVRNNPEGDPTPSRVDIEMTERIVDIAHRLQIVIHDRTIVARNGHASLKSLKII